MEKRGCLLPAGIVTILAAIIFVFTCVYPQDIGENSCSCKLGRFHCGA